MGAVDQRVGQLAVHHQRNRCHSGLFCLRQNNPEWHQDQVAPGPGHQASRWDTTPRPADMTNAEAMSTPDARLPALRRKETSVFGPAFSILSTRPCGRSPITSLPAAIEPGHDRSPHDVLSCPAPAVETGEDGRI